MCMVASEKKMKNFTFKDFVFIIALCNICVHGQSNGFQNRAGAVPDISEILRGTSVLESAVMDLSSAAAVDFVNKAPNGILPGRPITDIHGSLPPSPGGTHVDLPGEHGNTNDFPVLHREGVSHAEHDLHQAAMAHDLQKSAAADFSIVNSFNEKSNVGPDLGISKGIFHGENVFHEGTGSDHVQTKEFVDLTANTNTLSVQKVDPAIKPTLAKSDGFLESVPVVPVSTDGFVAKGASDGFLPEVNVVPLANVKGSQVVENSLIDMPTPHSELVPSLSDIHVDLPGEHGNIGNTAIVHRDSVPNLMPNPAPEFPVHNPGVGGHSIHVDMPGQHGNTGNTPVIHRELGPIPPLMPARNLLGEATPLGVHVDRPGEHGNFGDSPVVHREGVFPVNAPIHHGTNRGGVLVDRSGEHGNFGDTPVVHRESVFPVGGSGLLPPINQAIPLGSVHVDRPGEHGNHGNTPVVHRESVIPFGENPHLPPINRAIPVGPAVHVDLPGEHGNFGDSPVVHREHGIPLGAVPPVPGLPSGAHDIHIDAHGEHGNPHNEPVLHLPPGATVADARAVGVIPPHQPNIGLPPVGVPPVAVPPVDKLHPRHMDIHIDAPGEHGNPHNEPALHLPPGATIEDARAAGVIPPKVSPHPKHDIHIDAPGVFGNPLHEPSVHITPGARVIPPKLGPHPKHSDIHIDGPGEHGNPLNEPSLHLPPGATIDDARMAGVIPPHPADAVLLGPIVPTGVIPGTANVPIKPRRRGGRRRGGRRRGRRPGKSHKHEEHHPAPTTKKPASSGVTVIRISRPNPLGALANAVRGMLTGNNGGLLGSLFRTAAAPQGIRVVGPAPAPNNLVNSMLGNLFRG